MPTRTESDAPPALPIGKARRSRATLTHREAQIAELLCRDKSCKEAAHALDLSVRTIEHYVERLKKRFRTRTLHGLVAALLGFEGRFPVLTPLDRPWSDRPAK